MCVEMFNQNNLEFYVTYDEYTDIESIEFLSFLLCLLSVHAN